MKIKISKENAYLFMPKEHKEQMDKLNKKIKKRDRKFLNNKMIKWCAESLLMEMHLPNIIGIPPHKHYDSKGNVMHF